MNEKRKILMPRDAAGSFSFPAETGAIKHMLSMDGFMEIYTVHATYRVKTPDNLDPSRTVPNMPWSQSAHALIGASNPIVARILIQAVDALHNWPLLNGSPVAIRRHLHACKEEAVFCESVFNKLKPAYDTVVTQVNERKLTVQGNMVECPSVPNLRDEAATFLSAAKRALQFVGDVFNQFYVPDGKKPLVSNANFNFAIARIEKTNPKNEQLLEFLREAEPITKRFVELRNGLEHQREVDQTIIENFRLTPKGVAPPSWRRASLVVEGQILQEMQFFIQFLIEFTEHILFFGLMDNIAPNCPIGFQVEPIPNAEIDPECPVRFRLRPLLQ